MVVVIVSLAVVIVSLVVVIVVLAVVKGAAEMDPTQRLSLATGHARSAMLTCLQGRMFASAVAPQNLEWLGVLEPVISVPFIFIPTRFFSLAL